MSEIMWTKAKVNVLEQCFGRKDLHSLGSIDIAFSVALHCMSTGLTTLVFMDECAILLKVMLFSWCLVVAMLGGFLFYHMTETFLIFCVS